MELHLNFVDEAERVMQMMTAASGKTAEEIIFEGFQLRRLAFEESVRDSRTKMKFVRPNGDAVVVPIDTYGSTL